MNTKPQPTTAVAPSLTTTQQSLLAALRSSRWLDPEQVARQTKYSVATVRQVIPSLVELGLVQRETSSGRSAKGRPSYRYRRLRHGGKNGYELQLKVVLEDCEPPIWRRLRIPDNITLDQLSILLEAAMGWAGCGYHSHAFENALGELFGPAPEGFADTDVRGETGYPLRAALYGIGQPSLRWEYDLGDGWSHRIVVEQMREASKSGPLVELMSARYRCPPDDIGGVGGFCDFIECLGGNAPPKYFLEGAAAGLEDFDPLDPGFSALEQRVAGAARLLGLPAKTPKSSPSAEANEWLRVLQMFLTGESEGGGGRHLLAVG